MHQLWWWWNPSWQPWHRIWNSSIAYDYCDMVMWEGKGFFFFSSYELWVDSVHFLPIQTEQCFCTSKSEELLVECSWWQWWLWRHERPGINRQMLYTFLYRTRPLLFYFPIVDKSQEDQSWQCAILSFNASGLFYPLCDTASCEPIGSCWRRKSLKTDPILSNVHTNNMTFGLDLSPI